MCIVWYSMKFELNSIQFKFWILVSYLAMSEPYLVCVKSFKTVCYVKLYIRFDLSGAIHVKIGVDNKTAVRTTPKALRDYFHCHWPTLFEYKLSNISVTVMFSSMSGLTCVGNFIYHIRYLPTTRQLYV